MSPADLGLARWPVNPAKAREDRESVNQLVFHLTWAYVTTIDGVGFTVGHLFDELHTRVSVLTSMLDGKPWAAELRDVRDLLGEGQDAVG